MHRPRPSRRGVLRSASAASAAALGGWALRPGGARADLEGVVTPTISDVPATRVPGEGETVMYKTGSGLKYIDIVEGTGPTPRYGQLLSISYKGYVKLPPIKGVEQKAEGEEKHEKAIPSNLEPSSDAHLRYSGRPASPRCSAASSTASAL